MLRITLRIKEDDVEDVLDRMLPMLPAGVTQSDVGDGVVELAALGVGGHLPPKEVLEEAAGASLVEPAGQQEVPFDWRERQAMFGSGYVIADRVYVRSPLDPPPPRADLIDLLIERRESSFGTGAHPTTRACLELLLDVTPDGAFADLGCGTGALGIAAAKLGFGPVFAIDYTDDSVEATKANAERNGVDLAVFKLDLTADEAPPAQTVAANVPPVVHRKLAEDLSPEVRRLIVSGIVAEDSEILLEKYEARGLRQVRTARAEGWMTVLMERA